MELNEKFGWTGKVDIMIKNVINGKIEVIHIKNRLMNNALNEIIKSLYSSPNMEIKYVAIGDDDTANSDNLTTLYNEIFRTPVITQLVTGTGELQSRAILLDNEPTALSGVCTIKEIGFFGSTDAEGWNGGAGKDTGLLISRIVLSTPISKTATKQINFVRNDEIARG